MSRACVLLALFAAGCWTGPTKQGFYVCTTDAQCPEGWVCVSTADGGRCFSPDIDASITLPDAGPRDGGGVCDPTTHAGCFDDDLCCDGACALGTVTACEACGTECGDGADRCVSRSCRCGTEEPCSGATPFCVRGACEACADPPCAADECATDVECPTEEPVCDDGTCRGCASDVECPAFCVESGPHAGECGDCDPSDDAGCTSPEGICREDDVMCVECEGDDDCDGDDVCAIDTCQFCDFFDRGCEAPLVCVGGTFCAQCETGIECPGLGYECNLRNQCECSGVGFDCTCGTDLCEVGEYCDTVLEVCRRMA